jgi:hypothetical protein
MRDKINSDPKYQIGIIVVLILAAGYMLLGGGLGGGESEEEAAPTEATVAVAGTSATGTATGATPGEAVEGAIEGAVASATTEAEGSPAAIAASVPAPPLPHPVTKAYDSGKTVVLLIVHGGGIDDRLVAASTRQLAGDPGVAVFVVPVKQIARYGAITLGVDVQQVPALVVMRPRHLSHGTPEAAVIYGFQSAQSIDQAVRDASYKGPEATYHPN